MMSILPHQAWLLLQWLRNFAHTDFVTLLMSGTEHDITFQYKWIHESVKGLVHPEIKMQLLTLMSLQTHITFFFVEHKII